MKKVTKFISFLILTSLFLWSCANKPTQQTIYSDENTNEDDYISDGYTKTAISKKTGASNSIEHPNTILTLDNYLRGLAGVNVSGNGASATVRVHGVGSFQPGASEPLFILNGTALGSYSTAFTTINPYDIKRITVLTDAASTGIYGSRASNGVVVITLKESK